MMVLIMAAFANDCVESTSRDDLEAAAARASAAFEDADLRAFEDALEDARRVVPCLESAVSPSAAAQLHRIEALGAFVSSDEEHAVAAFGASKRLEPSFVFPDSWAPEGNPLRALYAASTAETVAESCPLPPNGDTLRFDGRPSRDRPVEHATLYQRVSVSGVAKKSMYLWPGDPIPMTPVNPPRQRSARVPLWVGAGVGLVASGAMIGGAAASRSAYDGDTTTLDNADGRRRLTNGLIVGSGTALTVGVGLGVAGLVVGR